MVEIKAKVEYGNLENLIKAMSKNYSVKVGLLASKNGGNPVVNKEGEVAPNMDVAGLGAVQEFGCDIKITDKMLHYLWNTGMEYLSPETEHINIPARSFLEMPLTQHTKELKNKLAGELSIKDIEMIISETGDFKSLAIMLGSASVEQIKEAFDTGGFGQWEPNHPYTIEKKGFDKPLVDTGRNLRDNIDFEVVER